MARSVLTMKLGSISHDIAFSPQQQPYLAISLSKSRAITLWDPVSGKRWHTKQYQLRLSNAIRGCRVMIENIAFSPCGRKLASGAVDKTVRLWDMHINECVHAFEGHTNYVNCVAFSPDGSLLASGSFDCTVRLWHVATKTAGLVMRGHQYFVTCVAFSPNGSLVSGSVDNTLQFWNILDGSLIRVLAEINSIYSISFSCNNLLAVGFNGGVKLWSVSDGECQQVRKLVNPDFCSPSVAFSPNGSLLVVGCGRIVSLMDVNSGVLLRVLKGHTKNVTSVAFHPNGMQVASASYDKTVRIWTVCEWNDRRHYLFGPELKRIVFQLMCVKARQDARTAQGLPLLPMEIWLVIFQNLACLTYKKREEETKEEEEEEE